jgi:hypothetical protein
MAAFAKVCVLGWCIQLLHAYRSAPFGETIQTFAKEAEQEFENITSSIQGKPGDMIPIFGRFQLGPSMKSMEFPTKATLKISKAAPDSSFGSDTWGFKVQITAKDPKSAKNFTDTVNAIIGGLGGWGHNLSSAGSLITLVTAAYPSPPGVDQLKQSLATFLPHFGGLEVTETINVDVNNLFNDTDALLINEIYSGITYSINASISRSIEQVLLAAVQNSSRANNMQYGSEQYGSMASQGNVGPSVAGLLLPVFAGFGADIKLAFDEKAKKELFKSYPGLNMTVGQFFDIYKQMASGIPQQYVPLAKEILGVLEMASYSLKEVKSIEVLGMPQSLGVNMSMTFEKNEPFQAMETLVEETGIKAALMNRSSTFEQKFKEEVAFLAKEADEVFENFKSSIKETVNSIEKKVPDMIPISARVQLGPSMQTMEFPTKATLKITKEEGYWTSGARKANETWFIVNITAKNASAAKTFSDKITAFIGRMFSPTPVYFTPHGSYILMATKPFPVPPKIRESMAEFLPHIGAIELKETVNLNFTKLMQNPDALVFDEVYNGLTYSINANLSRSFEQALIAAINKSMHSFSIYDGSKVESELQAAQLLLPVFAGFGADIKLAFDQKAKSDLFQSFPGLNMTVGQLLGLYRQSLGNFEVNCTGSHYPCGGIPSEYVPVIREVLGLVEEASKTLKEVTDVYVQGLPQSLGVNLSMHFEKNEPFQAMEMIAEGIGIKAALER